MEEGDDRFITNRLQTSGKQFGYYTGFSDKRSNQMMKAMKKSKRILPRFPERILDAPGISDDFKPNTLDWSVKNVVSIGLDSSVYLWNAVSNGVCELMSLPNEADHVSSLSWIRDGGSIAVGTSFNQVQIWDVETRKRVRRLKGCKSRILSLSWNRHLLASGCSDGSVFISDVRVSNHRVSEMNNHTGEICSLKWCPEGKYLACAGEDAVVSIWEKALFEKRIHVLSDHSSCVAALCWCPWQTNLLCTGGYMDRCLMFWNANTGCLLKKIQTKQRTTAALWSKTHRELVSAHECERSVLSLWNYHTSKSVGALYGHTQQINNISLSPNGEFVVSSSKDESLRFWRCFSTQKKEVLVSNNNSPLPKKGTESPFSKINKRI